MDYEIIGKVKSLYDGDAYEYVCDEVYFEEDEYCELRNESEEFRDFSDFIFISKEEFDQILEKMIDKLRNKF